MRSWWWALLVSLAALGGPGVVTGIAHAQVPTAGASAPIRDASGRLLATANFREGRGEVLISIVFPSQPVLSGAHAVHIAENGRCDPPDFATSGNILNPFNKKHGRQNPEGAEVGDLPNVNFSTGPTSYNTSAIGATLQPGPGSLLSPSRAILIYSGQDDQQTDPDGNSGSPIGCGLIAPTPGGPAVAAPSLSVSPSPVAVPRSVASPVAAVKPPVAVAIAGASPSPSPVVVAQAAAPTPILVLPTSVPLAATSTQVTSQAASSPSGGSTLTSVIIAVLGLCLIGVGYVLRRTPAT